MVRVSSYLYARRAPNWRVPSVIDCCYSSKGKVFFRRRLKNGMCVNFTHRKEICWGPSSSEGPQKRNLTMSSKHGLWTGTFGLRIKTYTMRRAWSWRRLPLLRSYTQGSFGSIAEKGTDLKGKRLFTPLRFFYRPIVNVKGMIVISHRLCPVPINRWTVPPYCSRWLVLACASRLYFYLL